MEGPQAINGLQLHGWRVAPISVLLTLPAALGILHANLLHGWPVKPSSDDLQRESSSPDMATANTFMELGRDAGIVISTHTSEDWVSIVVTKEFSIYQSIPPCIPLSFLSLRRLDRK